MQKLGAMNFRAWTLGIQLVLCLVWARAQPALDGQARWPEGEVGVDYNAVNASGERQGKWIRVWPDGTLYYEGQFDRGQPLGTFTFYYETCEVMSRIVHAENPKYMQATHYRTGGQVRAEGGYLTTDERGEDGELVRVKTGTWRHYDAAGTLRIEEGWSDGVLDGPYTAFDGSGRMVEQGSYAGGEKEGIWSTFNERGKALIRVEYARGQFHGDYEVNDDLGRNLVVGRHAHGQPIGAWVHYNDDRTVHVVRKYEEGKVVMERYENGVQRKEFKDERPQLEVHWENGKRHGPFTEWHDSGAWEVVDHTDPATGERESRLEIQGQHVAREGAYFAGELHGVVTSYSEEGRLLKRETYDHGQLVGAAE